MLSHHARGYDVVESAEPKWYRCLLQPADKQAKVMQTLQGLRVICAALLHNLATRIPRNISSRTTSWITCIVATRTLVGRCERKLKLCLITSQGTLSDKVGYFMGSLNGKSMTSKGLMLNTCSCEDHMCNSTLYSGLVVVNVSRLAPEGATGE